MKRQLTLQVERFLGGAPPSVVPPRCGLLADAAGSSATPSSGGYPPATPPSLLQMILLGGSILGLSWIHPIQAQNSPVIGADQLALTVIFDDRQREEIQSPIALAVLSDGREFRTPLTDDGSFDGDKPGDHVWVANLIFPRSQSITFSLRHEVQGEETTLFTRMLGLPAAASARVAVRAPQGYEDAFEVRDPYFYSDPRTLQSGLIPAWETQQVVAPPVVAVPTPPPGAGIAPPAVPMPLPPTGPGAPSLTTTTPSTPQGSLLWLWGVVLFLLWRELRPGATRLSLWILGTGASSFPPGLRARSLSWATAHVRRGDLPSGFAPLTTWQVSAPAQGGELLWITRPQGQDPLDWLLEHTWRLAVKQDLPCLVLVHPDLRPALALGWQSQVNGAGLSSHLTPRVLFFTGEVAELPELEAWLHRWGRAAILSESLEPLGLLDDLVERSQGLSRAAAYLFHWHQRLPGLTLWVGADPSDLITLEQSVILAESQTSPRNQGWSPPGETLAGDDTFQKRPPHVPISQGGRESP